MNDRDRENLNFLLSCNQEQLKDWYDNVTEDDREYAAELMMEYSEELEVEKSLIADSEISNLQEAIELLRKFRL